MFFVLLDHLTCCVDSALQECSESASDQGGTGVPLVGVVGSVGRETGTGAGERDQLMVGASGVAADPRIGCELRRHPLIPTAWPYLP